MRDLFRAGLQGAEPRRLSGVSGKDPAAADYRPLVSFLWSALSEPGSRIHSSVRPLHSAAAPLFRSRAFGRYSSELSRIIQAFKFDGRQNLAGLLAPLLAATLQESWSPREIDLIVPVPLHPKRKRERGYNQALLLARDLARLVGLPFRSDALHRVRSTLPQVGLSDAERARNLRRAFQCKKPAAVKGLRVLLIDDVMTTGSTVASAAEALLEGGALRVSVLTLARAVAGQE